MKINGIIVLSIAALVLTGILAGTANAQQAIAKDARFTLPFRATWEDTVLPPGDYRLSVTLSTVQLLTLGLLITLLCASVAQAGPLYSTALITSPPQES